MVAINLKREECIALIDKKENFWELSRNRRGRYTIRRLESKLLIGSDILKCGII
jgi:hypothetical protein